MPFPADVLNLLIMPHLTAFLQPKTYGNYICFTTNGNFGIRLQDSRLAAKLATKAVRAGADVTAFSGNTRIASFASQGTFVGEVAVPEALLDLRIQLVLINLF